MKTIDNYNILFECGEDDSGVIESTFLVLGGVLDTRDLNNTESILSSVTKPVQLQFSDDYTEFTELYDFVANTDNILIVSDRVKKILEASSASALEFIPAEILNHEDALIGKDYSIIHFLKRQPIIDMGKSNYKVSSFDASKIQSIDHLCIDISAIEQTATLFRASTEDYTNFITDDLLLKLTEAKITGIKTIKAEGWDGNTLSFI